MLVLALQAYKFFLAHSEVELFIAVMSASGQVTADGFGIVLNEQAPFLELKQHFTKVSMERCCVCPPQLLKGRATTVSYHAFLRLAHPSHPLNHHIAPHTQSCADPPPHTPPHTPTRARGVSAGRR